MGMIEVINFLHELDFLEVHLDEHQHFMQEIVVAESERTYSGMKKPLIFSDHKDRFSRFDVTHEVVPYEIFEPIPETYPEEERKKWFDVRRNNREAQQRYIFEKYKGRADYMANSDCDEIWSRNSWYRVEECMDKDWCYIAPSVKRFQNYVDAVGKGQEYWRMTKSTMSTHVRQKGVPRGATGAHVGWHFTSCYLDPKDMWYKGVGLAQSVGYKGWGDVHTPEQLKALIAEDELPFLNKKAAPRQVMPLDDLSWLPPLMQKHPERYPWLPANLREGVTISQWRLHGRD